MSGLGNLRRAFDEKRLAVVPIDLQKIFYHSDARMAYPVADGVARTARAHGIPNYWVAYTHDWNIHSTLSFAQKYRNTNLDFNDAIDVGKDELIFTKAAQGAFDTSPSLLHDCLKDNKIDTIAVMGVFYIACVTETMVGAMMKDLQVFALYDATDCHSADVDMWYKRTLRVLGDKKREHLLTMISSHEFKRALQPA